GLLRVAQEGFVQLLFTTSEIQRIELTNKVQREYLKIA
ncbi:TPA: DUF4365 domain-containing protein, partial [Escherichia coli]|nr:DUF4365 domain-containing protein [Escherichia coli]